MEKREGGAEVAGWREGKGGRERERARAEREQEQERERLIDSLI